MITATRFRDDRQNSSNTSLLFSEENPSMTTFSEERRGCLPTETG
ncbi:MAG: hypothetical protein OJF51_003588 [Nitrospira sp.]|nr:MAG: hypothetical protein OJF51_003588 [Nitrospira sp.]